MNEKKVTIITIVFLALILVAGGVGIWFLQFQVLEPKELERDRVKEELRVANEKVRQNPDLQKAIDKLLDEEKVEIVKIPNLERVEYDRFADLLDEIRRRAGVVVSRGGWLQAPKQAPVPGRPLPKPQPERVHRVQYDLTVTGGFYQLIRYINLLEQQNRFINVENFTITKSADSAATGGAAALKRDLKLTLFSYTYRPPAEALEIQLEEQRKGRTTDIPD